MTNEEKKENKKKFDQRYINKKMDPRQRTLNKYLENKNKNLT